MQTTAADVKRMLADQAQRVATHLLGNAGKREGAELRFGSLAGDEGKSLGVHLSGSRAGVWSDFATGESGDLLDLWAATRNVDIGTAIAEAKDWLGVRDVPLQVGKQVHVKPIPRPAGLHSLGPAALHFLREVRRISEPAAAAYKLAQRADDELVFPFLLPDGELANAKYRRFPNDSCVATKDGAKVLFGWQAIPANARSVVICEGEYKALIWWDYGFPALSVPFGGGTGAKQDWIEFEYDRLARFDTIYVAMDEDREGQSAADEIVRRLGPERCALVRLPLPAEPGAKDIQSCRRADVPAAAIATALRECKPRDPAELRSAEFYADEVEAMFADTGPEIGLRLPWAKVGDELVFRPGELTVIAGRTGHGKSQMVGFILSHAFRHGFRACVASLEFRVQAWLQRLVRQLTAMPQPASAYARRVVEWLGDKLWAFDAQGTADWKRMIEVFRYARRRHGVELFVIDNLTGLGIAEDDYQGQKSVTLALTDFARDEGCHVFLVHHIRKGTHEAAIPDKLDIKGSGAITDLASTVLTVWRNKPKEAKRAEATHTGVPMDPDWEAQPDVRLTCAKQRNYNGQGNGEPTVRLWWAPGCFHYLAKADHHARPFVTLDAAARRAA